MSHSPAFTLIDELIAALKAYSNRVEQLISSQWSPRSDWTSVEKACRESLLNGGKRFRPILVY
ncbi:MAG: hypothetical protein KDK40_02680, partial [Chlamydiia bacterium]|nr:hypothetical protein [Chlamydiia bacterium]